MEEQEKKGSFSIEISTITIVKIFIFFLIIWLLWLIREVIALFFIALILAAIVEPPVKWFSRHKIPKGLGLLIIYLILFAIFGLVIGLMIPPIVHELRELIQSLPLYWGKISDWLRWFKASIDPNLLQQMEGGLKTFHSALALTAGGIFSTLGNFLTSIISFFLVLVITFYIVVQEDSSLKVIRSLVPSKYQPFFLQLLTKTRKRISLWFKGQIILCFIIGIMSYLGLLILGIKYALILALLAGLLELIPYLGPILSAIPAVFFAFIQSPFLGVLVIVLYLLIQQLENHLIAPKVIQKTVGLNPLVSIFVLLVGGKLGGFLGILLAIPLTLVVVVFLENIFKESLFLEH